MATALLLAFALAALDDRNDARTPARPAAAVARPSDAALKSTQDFWHEWALQSKYKLLASKDQRVVVMLPEERAKQEHTLELVEKALQRADQVVPPLPPDKSAATANAPASGDATTTAPAPNARWEWGGTDHPLDSDTIVFAVFRSPTEYSAALALIAQMFPYLATWIEGAKKDPGCILERPLFGACVDSYAGMQEWNPDNEVVHRVGQLVMRRRFGQQPVWVGLGVGWNVEFDVLKTIYCFPWRNGFVSVHEHGGWESLLEKMFGRRAKEPLDMKELAAISRGKFDLEDSALAWGAVRYLTQFEPGKLSKLLLELHELREKLGKKPTADGKGWTMSADYDVPADEQKGAVERTISADTLALMPEFFRAGRHWQKPATKSSPPSKSPK